MVAPRQVKLVIFDLDGTLLDTGTAQDPMPSVRKSCTILRNLFNFRVICTAKKDVRVGDYVGAGSSISCLCMAMLMIFACSLVGSVKWTPEGGKKDAVFRRDLFIWETGCVVLVLI
jgi:hypothetical protein